MWRLARDLAPSILPATVGRVATLRRNPPIAPRASSATPGGTTVREDWAIVGAAGCALAASFGFGIGPRGGPVWCVENRGTQKSEEVGEPQIAGPPPQACGATDVQPPAAKQPAEVGAKPSSSEPGTANDNPTARTPSTATDPAKRSTPQKRRNPREMTKMERKTAPRRCDSGSDDGDSSNEPSASDRLPAKSGPLGDFFAQQSEPYTGPFKKVNPGDRHRAVMITWSDTKKGQYRRPSSREEFLRLLGNAMGRVQQEKCPSGPDTVNLKQCRIAVFQELHADFTDHLHSIVVFPKRTRVGSHIGESLLRDRIAVDVRGPVGKSGRSPAEERFLTYCMSVSEEKWLVDPAPLLYNMEIPLSISDAAGRAYTRLSKKPATLDGLYCYLIQNPSIVTPALLGAAINAECADRNKHKYHHLPYTRLRLLASKLGRSFAEEFQGQLNRIRAQLIQPDTPYFRYFEDAAQSKCACSEAGRLRKLLQAGINFHDEKEYYDPLRPYRSSRSHLGAYYAHLVGDTFPARQQSLCVIGAMGSGKSVVASQHLAVFPQDGRCDLRAAFVFKPTLDDTFPFTGISPLAKFVDLNDFRTSLAGFSPSTVLNLGEFAETKLAQKSGAPVEVRARLCISANYFAANGKWKDEDVDAMIGQKGRVFGGPIVWKHPLPDHTTCGTCRNCSSQFMKWCMEAAPGSLTSAATGPPPVVPTAAPSADPSNVYPTSPTQPAPRGKASWSPFDEEGDFFALCNSDEYADDMYLDDAAAFE